MKRKVIGGMAVLIIATVVIFNMNIGSKSSNLSDISLANVEALAQDEDSLNKPKGQTCETKSCKLDLGGGWFTASVERVCVDVDDPTCTCTPVSCGEVFYGCK